ncbi:hypothetical protein EJD97_015063 [Solanum chilense]|uniref:Uncharacterized protein n=1 Tax=Solanum chilense TaxID=4083 RepID=A0A6N2AED5_SOLCI|nr:hypothetical protein EJD97_015063 [Solanum chilense]
MVDAYGSCQSQLSQFVGLLKQLLPNMVSTEEKMGDAYGSCQSLIFQSAGLLKQLLPKYGMPTLCAF